MQVFRHILVGLPEKQVDVLAAILEPLGSFSRTRVYYLLFSLSDSGGVHLGLTSDSNLTHLESDVRPFVYTKF